MIDAARHGPWALIAGCSEGLGEHFAFALAAAGINLVLLARSRGKLEALAARVRAANAVEIRKGSVDLTAPGMMAEIAEHTDGLEVGCLIYNAGAGGDPAHLVDQPLDDALSTIHLNVLGQTLLARRFGAGRAKRGRGATLLLGSLGCVAGSKGLAVYTASKAYTQNFAEGLWAELEPLGVDVAAYLIGRTRTPALERTKFGKETDVPAAEPVDVVAYGLAHLQDGPVIVPPELQASFEALRSMPRRRAVMVMTRSLESQTK